MINEHLYSIRFIGKKEILEKKEAELTQLKQKTEMLNNALCRVEKEKDLGRLESGTLNEKLKTLQTEKESVIEKMKGLLRVDEIIS